MTFEEFFQKKRINLTALRAGEPGLFAEFKTHFGQMGEKSFDHTKKYWFNKLRQTYHLAPEQKPEKMHMENRLAEQTIVETLTESIPVRKAGFTPRFNSGAVDPNAESTPNTKTESEKAVQLKAEKESSDAGVQAEQISVNPAGFKPRFNPKMAPAKPAGEATKPEEPAAAGTPVTESPSSEATVKTASFKPRFNAKMIPAKPVAEDEKIEDNTSAASPVEREPSLEPASKPAGFKPRFNAKMMGPRSADANTDSEEIAKAEHPSEKSPPGPVETAPKPGGFKPRFNMKMVAPKVEESEKDGESFAEPAVEKVAEPMATAPDALPDESAAEAMASKPAGFKPRFNAAKITPKPPQEQ